MPSCIHCGAHFGNGEGEMEHAGTCPVMCGDASPSFRQKLQAVLDDIHLDDTELRTKVLDIALDDRQRSVVIVGADSGGISSRLLQALQNVPNIDLSIDHPTESDTTLTRFPAMGELFPTMPQFDVRSIADIKIEKEEKKKKDKPWNNKVKKTKPKWQR